MGCVSWVAKAVRHVSEVRYQIPASVAFEKDSMKKKNVTKFSMKLNFKVTEQKTTKQCDETQKTQSKYEQRMDD